MVFSSMAFLFVFLPALLVCYYLLPAQFRAGRNLVLLVFSLFFYYCAGSRFLPLILTSITVNYVGGVLADGRRSAKLRKWGVGLAVTVNLLLLGWFKYGNFVADNLIRLGVPLARPGIVLPVGISFFTFQGISYVIDVYRGDANAEYHPLRFALYLSLFPQLVAGPIVRYTAVAQALHTRRETLSDVADGGVRFLFGLAKKLLLANPLGLVADHVYGVEEVYLTTALAWLGAGSYMGQIYFDFSGYSDMAIGLGQMFGFQFPENFRYPYAARSVTDFWRRWHISLSSWFRDYVYIPLGGSRDGRRKHIRNIAVVWLLTGLWHGAAWNFVAWGAYYGILLLGEKFVWGRSLKRLPRPLRHGYTLLVVLIGWVFFRAGSGEKVYVILKAMAGLSPAGFLDGHCVYYLLEYRWELLLALPAALPVKDWCLMWLESRQGTWTKTVKIWFPKLAALGLFALSFLSLLASTYNPFIYFRF